MKSLPVVKQELSCTSCVASKQMRESTHCTKFIVKQDASYIPECFINSKSVSQAERNYLMCPTYNLGMYDVCQTCPLECVKNPKQNVKSPLHDIINLLGSMFGMDDAKKKEVDGAFERLNQPEFKEVYSSLERSSKSIKDVMNGRAGSSDIARKILEVESSNLKSAFSNLIKDGKITEEEARILNTEIHSSANMQKLKSVLNVMKQQTHEATTKKPT